jgi:WD40 repeat protein
VGPVKLRPFTGGPSGHFQGITLTADGKTLATAGADSRLKLWDVDTRKETATLAPFVAMPRFVECVAFSPDGKTLASGGVKQPVRLWDVAAKKEKDALPETVVVYSVAFSPDGKFLASGGGDSEGNFDRTKLESGEIQKLEDLPAKLEFKEIGEVKVWDLATKKTRTFYRGDTGRVWSLAFSPDGKTLAAGIRDGTVRLWDVATGKERLCLREKDRGARAVAFSPDGKTLAVALDAPTFAVVDWSTPAKLEKMFRERKDRVTLWDPATGRVRGRLEGHVGLVTALAFAPDGTLATATNVYSRRPDKTYVFSEGEVRLWDSTTGRPRGLRLTCSHMISSMAFGAGGRLLTVGGYVPRSDWHGSGPGEITLWDMAPRRGKAP